MAEVRASTGVALTSPVHLAARDGDLPKLKKLAESGANLGAKEGEHGWTPLHLAVEGGFDELVHFLIEQKVDINARDVDDETPLHYGAFWGYVPCVGWLLAAGAKVDVLNKYQWTPYDVAVRKGKDEVAQLLQEELRHRASVGLA